MNKYWNFYDDFGVCVWTSNYAAGDCLTDMYEWWAVFMADEEYVPEVTDIMLETFDGSEREMV